MEGWSSKHWQPIKNTAVGVCAHVCLCQSTFIPVGAHKLPSVYLSLFALVCEAPLTLVCACGCVFTTAVSSCGSCVSSKALLKCFPWNSETVSDLAVSPTEVAGLLLEAWLKSCHRQPLLTTTGVVSSGGRQEVLIMTSPYCNYLRAVCWERGVDVLFTPPEEGHLLEDKHWGIFFFFQLIIGQVVRAQWGQCRNRPPNYQVNYSRYLITLSVWNTCNTCLCQNMFWYLYAYIFRWNSSSNIVYVCSIWINKSELKPLLKVYSNRCLPQPRFQKSPIISPEYRNPGLFVTNNNTFLMHSFISTVWPFQSPAVSLLRTLSGGDPTSIWGRSSQLCSASLPLNPSATRLTGRSLTTAEWNSNWLVGTPNTVPHTQTHEKNWIFTRLFSKRFTEGQRAWNRGGPSMKWITLP